MYLVTRIAGFIDHFVAQKLIDEGHEVLWLDNINEYYDQNLKLGRLKVAGFDITEVQESGKPVTDFKLQVPIDKGVKSFIDWYKSYYIKKKSRI